MQNLGFDKYHTVSFLGIEFWNDSLPKLFQCLWEKPGMMVVPAAPALAEMPEDAYYRNSLRTSDYAIIDSIAVAIVLTVSRLRFVHRISGLKFIQYFLLRPELSQIKNKTILWIVPTEAEMKRIDMFLNTLPSRPKSSSYYLAPLYGSENSFRDESLFSEINRLDPDCVMVCIGGGKQEKLGFEMRARFPKRFPILCVGAAIAFLTGGQTKIPTWADRIGLGWFFRILENPSIYGRRYWKALYKFPVVIVKGGN